LRINKKTPLASLRGEEITGQSAFTYAEERGIIIMLAIANMWVISGLTVGED
jgi:hypothetical protein